MGVIQWSNNVTLNATSIIPDQDISVHEKKPYNQRRTIATTMQDTEYVLQDVPTDELLQATYFSPPVLHGGIFFISFHPSISGKNPPLAPALCVLIKGGTMVAEAHCEFMGRERERPPHNY